jgi:hypothetical protein
MCADHGLVPLTPAHCTQPFKGGNVKQPDQVEVERIATKIKLKFPTLSFEARKKLAVVLLAEQRNGVVNRHDTKNQGS